MLIFGTVEAQFDGCSAGATKVYPYVFGSNCTQTNKTNRVQDGTQGLTNVIIENTITDKNLDTYVALDSDNLCYFNESACSNSTTDNIDHYKGLVKVSGSSHTILWGKALTKHSLEQTQVTGAWGMAFKSEKDNPASKLVVAYVLDYQNNTLTPVKSVNQVVIRIFDTSNGDLISTNFMPLTSPISSHIMYGYYINNNRIVYTEEGQIYLTIEFNNKPCSENRQGSNFNYQVLKFYENDLTKVERISPELPGSTSKVQAATDNMGVEGVYYFRHPDSVKDDSSKNIMIWTGFQATGKMKYNGANKCSDRRIQGYFNLQTSYPVFLQISQTSSNMDTIIQEYAASITDRRAQTPSSFYTQIVGFLGKYGSGTAFSMTIVTQSNYFEFQSFYNEFGSKGANDHMEPHVQNYQCNIDINANQKLTCGINGGYRTLLSGGITIDKGITSGYRKVQVMDGSYTNLFGAAKLTSIWLMQVEETNTANRPEYVISIFDEDGKIRTRWLEQTWEHYQLPYRQSLRYFEHLTQGQEILIFAVNTIPEKGIYDFDKVTGTTTEHPFAGQQGILMGFDKDGSKTCLGQDTAVYNMFDSAANAANTSHNISPKTLHADSTSHMGHLSLVETYRQFTDASQKISMTHVVVQTTPPADPITLDAPDAIIEEYNAAPSSGTNYSALTEMMLSDIKIPENGMTAGPQNMTFCLKKHTTYTTADLVKYFRGNLYTDKKAYTASGPSTGLAVKKLDHNNHMKQKLGYVCPEGGCVPSSKFCGFPYLTMQEQELIAMDPFHDVYSNTPYILAYAQRITYVNMEADILVWNNTGPIHSGGYTNFHGVSRLTIKLKLKDTAQTEIGTFQVLFEYSDPSLGNNLASCADTASYGGLFYPGTQARIPVLYVDGSNATYGNFTAAFPQHTWPVSCQTRNLQIQMKLLDSSFVTLNQGGAITAAKIAQDQFLYHLIQSYDSYQLINITNGQEVNMTDSWSYFQNVLDGTLAFQISMNIRKKPAIEAPFFYQAILGNPTQSSTDSGQASKPILAHTSNATHTGELTCQKTTAEDQPQWSAQIVGIQLKNFTNDTAVANETFLFEAGEKPRVQGIYVYSGVQATTYFSEAEIYLDDYLCGKTPSQVDDGNWYYVSCHQRNGTMIKIKRQTPIADVALSFCGVYAVIAEEEGTAISKGLTFDMNLMNNSLMAFPFSFNMSSTSLKFLDSYNSLYVDGVDQGSSSYNSSILQKMTIQIAPDKWVWGCDTSDCSDYIGKQAYDIHGTACQAWELQSPFTHIYDPQKYSDVNLASNQCRNPVKVHKDATIKEPFCVTGQDITTPCSREVSFDSTQTIEQPVMIFQCETVNPTEKENLELFTKFYEGMFYFDAESERHIIFQKEENVITETTVDFHSPNQCITCDTASIPSGQCQYNQSKTSIEYDWKMSHLENNTYIDDIIITTNTSVGTKILTTTHAFNESFVHYNRTYMELKFWFNNTFEPVGGYYFEKKFNATICPILCKQRWIEQIEEFSIVIEATKMDLLFKIELEKSETELCPYYNFSAIIPTTLQWETPQLTNITIDPEDPSKVSFYLNQTMFTPDSIHTIVLESFENCFAQVKTLVLKIIVLPVPQQDLVKDGLVVPPDEEYTLDIGKPNTIRLGKYMGDRTDYLFVFFKIEKVNIFDLTKTRPELEEVFEVKDNYKKEKLQLKIDLSEMDLRFSRTTIVGTLSLTTMFPEETIYEDIKLHLCDPIDEKCPWEGPPQVIEEVEEEEDFKGVDVEQRDAELAAAEATKLALLVKPKMSKATFGPSGDLTIEFNQNMKLINQVYTKDLSTIMEIKMDSYEFEKTLVGTWIPKPNGETKEKRQLQERDTMDGFEWYVDDQSDNQFKFLTRFDNPQLISRLPEGQDKMEFKILKVGFFKSADNPDLVMDDSQEIPMIEKPMPQYLDKNTAEEIDEAMQNGKGAAASSGVVAILIAKALGGSLQTIWAMLSVMQDVSFNALIDIKYPAEIERRQVLMMEVAKVDILSLESYWSENWNFLETEALNIKFELYGMETKNFLINSGSLLVNMAGAIFSSLLFHIVLYFARNRAKKDWMFFILKNTVAPPIKLAFIAFLYQFCTDSVICAMLQWKAYQDMGLLGFLSYPGEWLNLIMSIIFVCSCFGVTAYGIYNIYNADDLEDPEFQIKSRSSIDGLDCSNMYKAQYNNLAISRKIFVSCMFIFVENGCVQSQVLLFVSGVYLCFVTVVKPMQDKISNRLKMHNETIIYLTLMCQFCMANTAVPKAMTETFANLYTIFLALGILVNMTTAVYTTYLTIKNYIENNKLRKFYTDQNKELKKQLAQNKRDEELMKKYKDSCMVLKAYEVKDFKKIMDQQGHESNNLVKEYMIEFRQNEQIKKIILQRKMEVEREQREKEEQREAEKERRQRIRGYVRRTHATKKDLGFIMEPNNWGQHEDFDKVDYDYDRSDGNRVVFKKHYVIKKKAQFGKLQRRKGLTKNNKKLPTIKEEAEESKDEVQFDQIEQAVNKALDPKIMFQNQWVQMKVHERRKAELAKISANGFRTEDSNPEPKTWKEQVQKLVNEPSGHRLQDDKLIEVNYHTNKTVINNELVANRDPYFAAAYQQIVKYKVQRLIHYLKIEQKKQYPNQNKD